MTTWEIIQRLLGGASFYWRKFFVFLLLCSVLTGGYWLWHGQSKTSAAYQFADLGDVGVVDQQTLDVVVTPNGHVLTQKKNLTGSLKILQDAYSGAPYAYEISFLALDSPGFFLDNFKVIIHLPEDVTPDQVAQRVYAVHGIESHREYMQDTQTMVYEASNIDAGASYTVVADLPKNILEPTPDKKFVYTLAQIPAKTYLAIAIILPLLTMIVLTVMIIRRRQDQIFYLSDKIINHPPNDVPPAIVGALMDGRVGAREIAATLIDLAQRGYLYINYHYDGTYSFGKRKSLNLEFMPELSEYERILLSKIFLPEQYKSTGDDVQMRIGRHIFSKKIAQVYLNIYNEATKRGYFIQNPMIIHLYWRYTGIVAFFFSLIGFFYTAFWGPDPKYTLFLWIGQMAASTVIIWLSGFMPVRSVTGTTVLRQWLQFKHYLTLSRRIEGGATIQDQFNKMLPYAIVFGVEPEWTRRFMSETFYKPDWYESDKQVITLEAFVEELFPMINYVGESLDKSHEPTVE